MPITTLLVTVGGSHEPILRAIRDANPDHVVFFCTGKDLATNRPGSEVQITGKGSVIKDKGQDKPTLPNIPTQAGLSEAQWTLVQVPADDLDQAVAVISATLAELGPDARVIADYTGGTKTMTAALVLAALESDNTTLQLVTGARADLVKVQSGMENVTEASVAAIRLRRAMAPYRGAWGRFAYGEAAAGLARLRPPPGRGELAAELAIARDVSRGLDAWDRFDHGTAMDSLDTYRPRLGRHLGPLLTTLGILVGRDASPDRQWASQLLDLWLNAQRRAAQGRYDDAVARAYRLLEWTAQWLLRRHCELDTGNVPPERIPEGVSLTANREGNYQAGLFAAWDLVGALVEGPAGVFAREQRGPLQDHIRVRNDSILAHGFTAIDAGQWQRFSDWLGSVFVPLLEAEAQRVGIKQLPQQLPTEWFWGDHST